MLTVQALNIYRGVCSIRLLLLMRFLGTEVLGSVIRIRLRLVIRTRQQNNYEILSLCLQIPELCWFCMSFLENSQYFPLHFLLEVVGCSSYIEFYGPFLINFHVW